MPMSPTYKVTLPLAISMTYDIACSFGQRRQMQHCLSPGNPFTKFPTLAGVGAFLLTEDKSAPADLTDI